MEQEEIVALPSKVFLAGFGESLQFQRTLSYFASLQSSSISTRQCFVMNGIIFLGSIVMFNHGITPLIEYVGNQLRELSSTSATINADWEYSRQLAHDVSSYLFSGLWLAPMYMLSFLLNTVWYFDIAKQVYFLEYGKVNSIDPLQGLRDSLYSMLLMAWVSLGSYLIYYVNFIGPLISLMYTSWAISFYCFDYKLTLQGVEFETRLRFFQSHWIYMLGFGLPCASVIMFLPRFLGYGIYAVVFPICMVLAIISTPVQHSSNKYLPRSIKMFAPAELLNLSMIRLIPKLKPPNRKN